MRSPFHGMDPYLENPAIWMDFHESFITYCRDALNDRLPDAYEARVEERVSLVELPEGEIRWFRPDVAVSDLVEIDLLLEGQRVPHGKPLPAGDYYAYVSRGERRPNCDVFGWSIRQPIPPVPIPLRPPDADLILDLQALFETTYVRGRYRRSLAYSQKLGLPLSEENRQWATELAGNAPQGS